MMKVIWMGFLGVLVMRNSMFASQYLFMRQHEYNDAGTLPGECADFIFHKYND